MGGSSGEFNREVPSVGRVYGAWLGSPHTFRADRTLARAIEEQFPGTAKQVQNASAFLGRAVAWTAGRGVSRFICAGAVCYLSGAHIHDAPRAVGPGARVIYVDPDADAHVITRALLAGEPGISAVLADTRDAAAVLAVPDVAAVLDEAQPVCLALPMLLHFLTGPAARELVAAYEAALPSGSYLVISVVVPDKSPESAEFIAAFTPARIRRHTAAAVERWLGGLELTPGGVADVRTLPGRAWADARLSGRAVLRIVGAVARKP